MGRDYALRCCGGLGGRRVYAYLRCISGAGDQGVGEADPMKRRRYRGYRLRYSDSGVVDVRNREGESAPSG